MSATLFSGIVNGDGESASFADLVRAERYVRPATLALHAWCGRGFGEPKQSARLYLETSSDGSNWSTLVDFGDVREDVVSAEATWDGTGELRVRYEFAPDSTWYWWPVVRLD